MKHFVRIVCVVIAFALLGSMTGFAEETGSRASEFFWCYDSYLHKTSSTTFEVWFDVSALGRMEELGASYIKVQRSSDEENWITVQTYSSDYNSDMLCENTAAHASYVSYTGRSGYYYRAYVTFYAKNSNGEGYRFFYTETIWL